MNGEVPFGPVKTARHEVPAAVQHMQVRAVRFQRAINEDCHPLCMYIHVMYGCREMKNREMSPLKPLA